MKNGLFEALVTAPTCDLEDAFSTIPRKIAKEMNSSSARAPCSVRIVEREVSNALK